MNTSFAQRLQRTLNSLEVVGIIVLSLLALGMQFILKELPCPLCLLQRIGFIGIACGFLLNLRSGVKPSHYAISLLFALFTILVSLRQIALLMAPGSAGYGPSVLGLHLYSWSFVISLAILIFTAVLLSVDSQYRPVKYPSHDKKWLTHLLFFLVMLVVASNFVAVYFQCGLSQCPDNPTAYVMLS